MNSKSLTWIFMAIGSTVGSNIPLIWGAGFLSFSSIILGAVGAMIGVYIAFRISN